MRSLSQARVRVGGWSAWRSAIVLIASIAGMTACGDGTTVRSSGISAPASAAVASAARLPAAERLPFTGTLGGMSVRIPRHFVTLMEFSGEPTDWKRGPRPVEARPADAPRDISSFAFDVRYPDMAGLSTPELRQDFWSKPFRGHPWMTVGVSSGDQYPGPEVLRRLEAAIGSPLHGVRYAVEASDVPGLARHVVQGLDPQTGESYRYSILHPDIYVAVDGRGQVRGLMYCMNTRTGRESCKHVFLLEPEARVQVLLSYGRELLPQWQDIEARTRALLLGFEVR